jgi:ribosomal protein S18 acetylase RimI-like enzyme
MSEVEIIALPIDRWPDYRAIRLSALRTDPLAFGERYQDALTFPDEIWRQRLDGSTSIVRFAERQGQIVGLAVALLGSPDDERRAQIVSVFVEPDHRGLGIGRLLLDRILEELAARPQFTRLRLNVTETQSAAKALYESLGFVVVGAEDHPAADGEERFVELVMERDNQTDAIH